jgi:hypothetical protein
MGEDHEDRGVELGEDEIPLAGTVDVDEQGHVLDATGRPAKEEYDKATD